MQFFWQQNSVPNKRSLKHISVHVCKVISFFTDHQYALTCHYIYYLMIKADNRIQFQMHEQSNTKRNKKKNKIRSKFEDTKQYSRF